MSKAPAALITGGGSGIGRATALHFAQNGYQVSLLGRTRAKLESVAEEITQAGWGEPLVINCRQEDQAEAELAVSMTEEAFGRLDVLFNNAAVYCGGSARESTTEEWEQQLSINVLGPLYLARAALNPLEKTQGVIINNASTLGIRPIAGYAAYSASKAALVSLTKSIALEEAQRQIRCVAICPGVVDTPIHGEGDRSAQMEAMGPFHPLGRVGTPEEIASLVYYLASAPSKWITGSIITIDGGISL